jgi:hypothetical protein
MLEIRINNEPLDLADGTVLDMEVVNPFLQFSDSLIGGWSFPFQVRYTERNLRLLNYSGIFQKQVDNSGINASVYDSGLFLFQGKIKIERSTINLNNHQRTVISCYLLTDAADFYQSIKNVKLRDADYGGERGFAGTDDTPWYESSFGTHVLNVAKGIGGPYDYAFFPVKNSSWGGDPGFTANADVMNKVYQTEFGMTIGPIIVPFPYLKYVLLQAIDHIGWTIEGDILSDADFETIAMINFRAIDWAEYVEGSGEAYNLNPYGTVIIDIKNHLPDMSMAEFLIALKNRFAWWYDIDSNSKKITIRKLSEMPGASIKDVTSWADATIQKQILAESVIYALRNNFVTGGGEGIDITKLDYQGAVDGVGDLPGAGSGLNEQVYLVEEENNYYACLQDPDNEATWRWERISANIYDYVPAGANEDITTKATTVGLIKYDDYMDMIPECDGIGVWKDYEAENAWGIHLAFNLGWIVRKLGPSGGFAYKYPQATHHLYDTNGVQLTNWSLAYKGQKTDGTQVGLYDLNWKAFLAMINNSEGADVVLYPTLAQYLALQFSDILMLDGVKLFMAKKNVRFPYKNNLPITANRIS